MGRTGTHVIVVGNEKGGSGKSTTAFHLAIYLLYQGFRVASIDVDSRQQTFTNYVKNRRNWAASRDLKLPHATVTAHVTAGTHGLELTLHAETLARDIWISFGDQDMTLTDNAFTLLPGENRSIPIKSTADAAALERALHVQTLDTATMPSMAGAGD